MTVDDSQLQLLSSHLSVTFDPQTGSMSGLTNRLTGDSFQMQGDAFEIHTPEAVVLQSQTRLAAVDKTRAGVLQFGYELNGLCTTITYRLADDHHFLEKAIAVRSPEHLPLTQLVSGRLRFSGPPTTVVRYPHLKAVTFFARTSLGGLFLGTQCCYDDARLENDGCVVLAFSPSMMLRPDREVSFEPAYLGVYRSSGGPLPDDAPSLAESDAMVRMTSALMPAAHADLRASICGFHSETWRAPYRTPGNAAIDRKAIDVCTECGIDGVTDARTWAGETKAVNALQDDHGRLLLGELAVSVARYAREKGARWIFWGSVNHSAPWGECAPRAADEGGRAFRPDKPTWRMEIPAQMDTKVRDINCLACEGFLDWLTEVTCQALDQGRYEGLAIDGNFYGKPAWYKEEDNWVPPARCESEAHDHLVPDANYLCQRYLAELVRRLRERHPDLYIYHARPVMDLGVWSMRHASACFTIDEFARIEPLPGMSDQPTNVILGDKIRRWSRIRVHRHFLPHYLDSPQVFRGPKSIRYVCDWPGDPDALHALLSQQLDWPSEKIDYILLSALSCSPNLLLYLPTQAGIPQVDRREIKRVLDWGRSIAPYLYVRKDLPDWPAAGKVDGSAHIIGHSGYLFLFNPNGKPLPGRFQLDASIGLAEGREFEVRSVHGSDGASSRLSYGDTVRWEIPAQSAVVLKVIGVSREDPPSRSARQYP